MSEDVVLLDESGAAVGTRSKTVVHTTRTPLHLAFSCYLFDPDGRLLLTRRSADKPTWPDTWTNSCCGHPLPGEPVDHAVRRRLGDELGIYGAAPRLVLPRFRYRATMPDGLQEHEACPVFVVVSAAAPAPDPREVAAVRWVGWSAFLADAAAEDSTLSPWSRMQSAELAGLGPDPLAWPAADAALLPPAATLSHPAVGSDTPADPAIEP